MTSIITEILSKKVKPKIKNLVKTGNTNTAELNVQDMKLIRKFPINSVKNELIDNILRINKGLSLAKNVTRIDVIKLLGYSVIRLEKLKEYEIKNQEKTDKVKKDIKSKIKSKENKKNKEKNKVKKIKTKKISKKGKK